MKIIPEHQVSAAKLSEILDAAFFEPGDISSEAEGVEMFDVKGGGLSLSLAVAVITEGERRVVRCACMCAPLPKLSDVKSAAVVANSINAELRGMVTAVFQEDCSIWFYRNVDCQKGMSAYQLVDSLRLLDQVCVNVFNVELQKYM